MKYLPGRVTISFSVCLSIVALQGMNFARSGEASSSISIKFGTKEEMLKSDGSGGTYVYERKYFKSDKPFVLKIHRDPAFAALGRVDFHLQVLSLSAPKRTILNQVISQSGDQQISATFTPAVPGPYLVRIRLDAEVKRMMEARLFPARLDSPLPPWSFSVDVTSAREVPSLALVDKESYDRLALRLSGCDVDLPSTRRAEEVERISTIGSAAALTTVATVRLFGAAPEIYVDIPVAWRRRDRRIYLQIESKRSDDSSYQTVCKEFLLSQSKGHILARSLTQGEWLDWRVELRFERSDQVFYADQPITISRETFLALPPSTLATADFDRSLAFICFGSNISDIAVNGATEFAKSFRLNVVVRDSSYRLSTRQMEGLEKLTLDVTSAWNRACIGCQPLNLSIITINEKNFAHSGVGQWVRSNVMVPLDANFLDMSLGVTKGRNRVGTNGITSAYQPIGEIFTEFHDICKIDPAPSHSNTKELQRHVCNQGSRANSSVNILIDFANGRTACGDDKNIIACRADNELTEFNVRDFQFIYPDSQIPPIGRGKIEIDLSHALIHEMGHWIGLGHIDGGRSVMASSLEQSRCIDAYTVQKLGTVVAADLRVKPEPLPFTLEKRRAQDMAREGSMSLSTTKR